MAYSVTALLPGLYDLAADAEAFSKKRGGRVVPYAANRAAAAEYLLTAADRLEQFNALVATLDGQREQLRKMSKIYFVLGLVLVAVLGAVTASYAHGCYKQALRDGVLPAAMDGGGTLAALAIATVTLYIVVHDLYRRSALYYERMYDVSPLLADPVIGDAVRQFQLNTGLDDGSELPEHGVRVTTNNPLMVYYYAQQHPDKTVEMVLGVNGPAGAGFCRTPADAPSADEFMKACAPEGQAGYVYPFVPGGAFSAAVLRKRLQRFDAYGQVARMTAAVNWFKGFMLKASDEVYGGGDQGGGSAAAATARGRVVQGMAALLRGDAWALVDDLVITGGSTSPAESMAACVRACLADDECVAVSFDAARSTCRTLTRAHVAAGAGGLAFSRSGGAQAVLLHCGGAAAAAERLTVTGASLDSGFLAGAFAPAADGACDASSPAAGCLVPSQQTAWMSAMQAAAPGTTYDRVFGGTDAAPVPVAFTCRFADVAARARAAGGLGAALRANKAAFVDALADFAVAQDPSGGFALAQADVDALVKAVADAAGSDAEATAAAAAATDLLLEVPARVQQRYRELQEQGGGQAAAFIPYERFVEKLKQMSTKDFVVHFLSNAEELRTASAGLRMLRDRFDCSRELRARQAHTNDLALTLCTAAAASLWLGYAARTFRRLLTPAGPKEVAASPGRQVPGEGDLAWLSRHAAALRGQADDTDDAAAAARLRERAKRVEASVSDQMAAASFRVVVTAVMVAVGYSVVRATLSKRRALQDFNQGVLDGNGAGIANDSRAVMQLLYDDMAANRYGLMASPSSSSSASTSAAQTPGKLALTNDASEDEYFEAIVKAAVVSDTAKVQPGADAATLELYLKLARISQACDKCNSLSAGYNSAMPAPVLELAVYATMLVLCVVVLLYVAGKFRPLGRLSEVRQLVRARKRLNGGGLLPREDWAPGGDEDEDDPDNVGAMVTVRYTALALLVLMGAWFFMAVQANAARYSTALYSTRAFTTKQCSAK